MVVFREKGNVVASINLLLRSTDYYTVRHRTVMTLQQIKETEMEIMSSRVVIITKING